MSIPGHRLSRTQERPAQAYATRLCCPPPGGDVTAVAEVTPKRALDTSFMEPEFYFTLTVPSICSVRMPTATSCLFCKLALKPPKQKKVAGSSLHTGDFMEPPTGLCGGLALEDGT